MAFASINRWCTPAYVFFVVSILFTLIVYVNGSYNQNIYCLGNFQCNINDMRMIFIFKFIFILFWTWILNLFCRSGFSIISWILLILPFVFIISSFVMIM
jgi:hypothetical protein